MRRFIILLVSLCLAVPAFANKIIEREFEVSAGEELKVNLKSGGSIEIEGWNRDLVAILIEFRRGSSRDFNFEFDRTSYGVEIYSKAFRGKYKTNYTIYAKVPKKFDVSIESAGGYIKIDNITGRISGSTGGGGLQLSNLNGEIRLETGGGAIEVLDSRLNGRVTTGGGSALVENVEGDLDVTSGGGEIVYRNVKTSRHKIPSDVVYIRNAGGAIRVNEAVAGADLKTGGGNISVRFANEFVKANTGGGNIYLEAVDGWVEASTGAGDVEVTLTNDSDERDRDVNIRTGSGDVTLTIPEEMSFELDIELAYTKRYDGQSRIISDFDIEKEETSRWDNHNGSPKKYIYGSATINGGDIRIKIRAVNGNVTLIRK